MRNVQECLEVRFSILYSVLHITLMQFLTVIPVHVDRENGFHLELEDYLGGLLLLADELVYLADDFLPYGFIIILFDSADQALHQRSYVRAL